jgi:hypothetical protein
VKTRTHSIKVEPVGDCTSTYLTNETPNAVDGNPCFAQLRLTDGRAREAALSGTPCDQVEVCLQTVRRYRDRSRTTLEYFAMDAAQAKAIRDQLLKAYPL